MNYGGLFDWWEIAVAKKLIHEYRENHRCLQKEDFDDLLQECLIAWLDLRDQYDPSRDASRKTFMAGVVRIELCKIIEKATAEKRKTIYESVSLDQPLDDEEGAPTLKDKIPDTKNTSPLINSELKKELSKAYEKLTPRQQKLYKLLAEDGLSINAACKHFNNHRSIVYREVIKIREVFEKEGLRDYLR